MRLLLSALFAILFSGGAHATDRAFGDSLTDVTGQTVTGYIAALNSRLPTTFSNQAHGGGYEIMSSMRLFGLQ
jgi:hypothetical protein